ncbi:MAG: hypothetical protein JWP81_4341 [Ferruginibacter sp.]|nr:hypothetical protein [Ferruginibacter sp.]
MVYSEIIHLLYKDSYLKIEDKYLFSVAITYGSAAKKYIAKLYM